MVHRQGAEDFGPCHGASSGGHWQVVIQPLPFGCDMQDCGPIGTG
jgi:hypothetical protein